MNRQTEKLFFKAVDQIYADKYDLDNELADAAVIKRFESLRRIKNKAANVSKSWRDDILTLKYTAKHTSDKLATGFRQ